jgi:hypothetical protein
MFQAIGRFRVNGSASGLAMTLRPLAFAAALLAFAAAGNRPASAQTGGMPNLPPHAQDDSGSTIEGFPTTIAVLNNDFGMSAPLDPTSVEIITEPLNGIVSVDPSTGNVGYLPDPGFDGVDDFTYVVSNARGLVSNVATVTVYVMEDMQPPVIANFSAAPSGNGFWTLTGQVLDDAPGGITVTFGGVVSGSTVTQIDGTFSYRTSVSPGTYGQVTAQALNDDGVLSQVVSALVFSN